MDTRPPARPTKRASLNLLLALCTAACGSAPPAKPRYPPVSAPPPEANLSVTLIDPGREPREPLRYHIPPGLTELMLCEVASDFKLLAVGRPPFEMKTPAQRITMTLSAAASDGTAGAPGAKLAVKSAVTGVEVVSGPGDNRALVEKLQRLQGSLVGTVVSSEVDERGFVSNVTLATPERLAPELKAIVANLRAYAEQSFAPLPAEPVGRGARWMVDATADSGSIYVRTKRTFTMVGRTANQAILSVVMEQTADPQPIRPTVFAANANSTLVSHRASGSGNQVLNLNRLAPNAKAASEATTTTEGQGTNKGKQTTLVMKMNIALSPKVAPAAP